MGSGLRSQSWTEPGTQKGSHRGTGRTLPKIKCVRAWGACPGRTQLCSCIVMVTAQVCQGYGARPSPGAWLCLSPIPNLVIHRQSHFICGTGLRPVHTTGHTLWWPRHQRQRQERGERREVATSRQQGPHTRPDGSSPQTPLSTPLRVGPSQGKPGWGRLQTGSANSEPPSSHLETG